MPRQPRKRNKTGETRIFKHCPLCQRRYWVEDLKHLDNPVCVVTAVRLKQAARGWSRCGSGGTLITKCRIPCEKLPSSMMGGGYSEARFAPAWASVISNLFLVGTAVRKHWLCLVRDMPEDARAPFIVELDCIQRLSARDDAAVASFLVARLGLPAKVGKSRWYSARLA